MVALTCCGEESPFACDCTPNIDAIFGYIRSGGYTGGGYTGGGYTVGGGGYIGGDGFASAYAEYAGFDGFFDALIGMNLSALVGQAGRGGCMQTLHVR